MGGGYIGSVLDRKKAEQSRAAAVETEREEEREKERERGIEESWVRELTAPQEPHDLLEPLYAAPHLGQLDPCILSLWRDGVSSVLKNNMVFGVKEEQRNDISSGLYCFGKGKGRKGKEQKVVCDERPGGGV